jgi:hypothetical protein
MVTTTASYSGVSHHVPPDICWDSSIMHPTTPSPTYHSEPSCYIIHVADIFSAKLSRNRQSSSSLSFGIAY